MNKKNNRKGFTIVELVIVIAVIAILATVLVPTFGNVIENANRTALVQQIKNEHTNYTNENAANPDYVEDLFIRIGNDYYEFKNGTIVMSGTEGDEAKTPKAYKFDEVTAGAVVYETADNSVKHVYKDNSGTCEVCGENNTHANHATAPANN